MSRGAGAPDAAASPQARPLACGNSAFSVVFSVAPTLLGTGSMTGSLVVLVVDDESDLAESCARLLRRRGYRVVTATSCATGHAALAGAAPALIVSDVRLPDGDGLDLVRAASALTPPVPAIVISGYLSAGSQMAARAAGAVAFLSKPFTTDALSRTVDKALGRPTPDGGVAYC